jgi:hypothetical protein
VPISEKVIFFSAMSVVDAKPFAINSIPFALLLLLLLLTCVHHPPLRQRDRLAQHLEIADMIGKDQNQRRIEIGALLVTQSAMRLDDGAKGIIRFGEI